MPPCCSGEAAQLAFDRVDGAGPQLGHERVPGDLARRGRSSPGTAACRAGCRRRRARRRTTAGRPWGQVGRSRRGRHGPSRRCAWPGRPVRSGRVCTIPNDGGVRVRNDAGCAADRVGDAFAAAQAGGDEVVGVPPVDLARRPGTRTRGGCRTACRGPCPAASRCRRPRPPHRSERSPWPTRRAGGPGGCSRRRGRRGLASGRSRVAGPGR